MSFGDRPEDAEDLALMASSLAARNAIELATLAEMRAARLLKMHEMFGSNPELAIPPDIVVAVASADGLTAAELGEV